MGILRILLAIGLIVGCAYLALRAPYMARLEPTMTSIDLGNAPLWAPPEAPAQEAFPGFGKKEKELPGNPGYNIVIDTGLNAVVALDKRKFFGKACIVVVGLFCLFGIAGTIIQRKPATSDVAFSLWISLGMLAGIAVSATIGQMGTNQKTTLPFFSECMLVGFIVGLLIALKSHPILKPGKSKKLTK